MNRSRSVVLGALAWVLVVSLGATAVWTVVSEAGQGVAGEIPTVVVSDGSDQLVEVPVDQSPAGSAVRESWRGEGGSVVVACDGGRIDLVSARPASGWKAEVDEAGPQLVRVELETADERTRVRVEGRCVDGAPDLETDTRTKG